MSLLYKIGTPVFGEFLPFVSESPLTLCQVRWGALLHSYFHVSPEIFNRVQVWALAGLPKDIQGLVPNSLLGCLDCVFRVVVLLEGEPLHQSEVLSALEQVFIYFAPFIFPSILTSLPVPAFEKHPHSMILQAPSFIVGMVPGFLQT